MGSKVRTFRDTGVLNKGKYSLKGLVSEKFLCSPKKTPQNFCKMLRASKKRGEGKTHVCEICDKSCTSAATLKTHLLGHTEEKPFSCELCNYTGTSPGSLKKHMLNHIGEKPHNCKLCSFSSVHAA